MRCPTCQAVVLETRERCPVCGEALRPIAPADAIATPEAMMTSCASGDNGATTPPPYASGRPAVGAFGGGPEGLKVTLILAEPEARRPPVLARLPELPALAWRHPVVRAVVKSGAGALALSLAVRAAQRMLAGSGRVAAPLTGRAPRRLAETLRAVEPAPAHGGVRRGPAIEVTEVFIYARRVLHR